jgi:uridylate kinase
MRPYKRILLKASGEMLAGEIGYGIDGKVLAQFVEEIASLKKMSPMIEIVIVVGGGNWFRGKQHSKDIGVKPMTGDFIGMKMTEVNALALEDVLCEADLASEGRLNLEPRVMTALSGTDVAEKFIVKRAKRHLEKGRIVICAGGTGKPFFTTDTAAALYASQLGAEAIFKMTNVDGVYNADPKKYEDATRFDQLTFDKAIELKLGVLDPTAFTLCQEQNIPIVVFEAEFPGCLTEIIQGKRNHTLVSA